MAFFKLRKGGDESPTAPPQPESIEAMRRRARHRLIGATVLLVAGVVGFPLLFDTQPRPISVDIPITIPDRNKVKPLAPAARTPAASGQVSGPAATVTASSAAGVASSEPASAPASRVEAKVEAKAEPKTEAAAEKKSEAKAETRPGTGTASDDGTRAKALLEGKPPGPEQVAAADSRFVVQVGAFADANKARDARQRVEKAGLKTYTHVAETKDGPRIRVRVGPFPTRAEADRAAETIKGLELPAAILTL